MPVFNNMLAGASGGAGAAGYEIERSLRFNSGDSAHLSRTPSSAGNRRTWTWSGWVKKTSTGSTYAMFGSGTGSNDLDALDFNGEQFRYTRSTSGSFKDVKTNALHRDSSAWYHVVLAVDTTQATSSNRVKLYVNGDLQTSLAASNYPSQNEDTFINSTEPQVIGRRSIHQDNYFDGYLAEVNFIDGQALAPTDFGETDDNGVWQPKKFAGTYVTPASTVLVGSPSYPSSFTSSGNKTSDQTGLSFGSWSGTYTGAETKIFKNSNTAAFSLQLSLAGPTTDRLLWYSDNATDWTYVGNVSSLSNPYTLSGHKYYATSEGSGSATVTASSPATGVNSFHLPFTDNSSNAALGTDTSGNSNTWTVNNLSAAGITGGKLYKSSTLYTTKSDIIANASLMGTGDSLSGEYLYFVPSGSEPSGAQVFNVAGVETSTGAVDFYYYSGSSWSNVYGAYYDGEFVDMNFGANDASLFTLQSNRDFYVIGSNLNGSSPAAYSGTSPGINLGGEDIDSLVDTPTNATTPTDTGAGGEVVGNYATLNPLDSPVSNSGSLTNGNLNLNGTVTWSGNRATIAYPSSGKWYYETQVNGAAASRGSNSQFSVVGLCKTRDSFTGSDSTNNILWLGDNGYGRNFSSNGTDIFGANIDQGKIIGLAVNMDNNTFEYFVDGVSKQTGTINVTSGTSLSPYMASYGNSQTSLIANFGQRAFAYTAPSGYKALCTANLDPPTIADGSKYFDVDTYNGTGSTLERSEFSFNPDFVWIKQRDNAGAHMLFDSVRGVKKRLVSNQHIPEGTVEGVTSFDSDGFTLGDDPDCNMHNKTHVAWAWDAGSSNTTIAAGSLNSSLYNQSQTWSNSWGSNVYNGTIPFDGNLTTNTNTNPYGANVGSTWTHTIAFTTSVKLWVYTTANEEVKVNGTSVIGQNVGTSTTQPTLVDVTSQVTSPITSVFISRYTSGGSAYLFGIEIDGKLLVDSGVSITTPSIASTVRANPSAGFSIVTATISGAGSIGHGLNAKPHIVFRKRRNGSGDHWYVSVDTGGVEGYMLLNTTANLTSEAVGLTSSTFSAGWVGNANETWVNYCFAPVEGYSAMGSYVGSSSLPFVYTGFTPRWILIKANAANEHWIIIDSARDTYNLSDAKLSPSSAAIENDSNIVGPDGTNALDILSNGFKLRTGNSRTNGTGTEYIYFALAEHPFKTARAR